MPIRSVADAMNDLKAGSTHIKTRAQAIAVGLKAEGKSRSSGGRRKKSRSLSLFSEVAKWRGR
jgi:hypothetical protein